MGTRRARQTDGGRQTSGSDILERASARVESETEIVDAEEAAFRAFAKRVAHVDPDTASRSMPTLTPGSQATMLHAGDSNARGAGDVIRDAYQRTVMDVPHYEREYGDSVVESITDEFGPEIASALTGTAAFSPAVKNRLLEAISLAIEHRKTLELQLIREARALTRGREVLEEVEGELEVIDSRPFFDCDGAELRRLDADLRDLEAQCSTVAVSRQQGDLSTLTTRSRTDTPASLRGLLYDSLDVQYPLLAAAAETSSRLDRTRTHVATALETITQTSREDTSASL